MIVILAGREPARLAKVPETLALPPRILGQSAQTPAGNLAAQSGERLDRGEECLELYLAREPKKTEPSLATTHLVLGRVYEKKGSRDLARREYEAALKIDPSLKDAQEALKKVS